jgi:hypothetical protein
VHFIVDNVASGSEINWVDYLVIAVVFVAVEIFGLAAVSWVELACLIPWLCEGKGAPE